MPWLPAHCVKWAKTADRLPIVDYWLFLAPHSALPTGTTTTKLRLEMEDGSCFLSVPSPMDFLPIPIFYEHYPARSSAWQPLPSMKGHSHKEVLTEPLQDCQEAGILHVQSLITIYLLLSLALWIAIPCLPLCRPNILRLTDFYKRKRKETSGNKLA